MSDPSNNVVDWVCQNCGEFNKQPQNDPPTKPCLWCGELVGWTIAEHDRSIETGAGQSKGKVND